MHNSETTKGKKELRKFNKINRKQKKRQREKIQRSTVNIKHKIKYIVLKILQTDLN